MESGWGRGVQNGSFTQLATLQGRARGSSGGGPCHVTFTELQLSGFTVPTPHIALKTRIARHYLPPLWCLVPAHPTHSPSLTAVAPPPPATVCAASTDDVGEGRTPLFRLVGASFVGDSRCSLRWVCLRSVSPIWAYTPLPLDGWSVRRERICDFLITPSEKFQFLSGYDF